MAIDGVLGLHQQATAAGDEPSHLGNNQDVEESGAIIGLSARPRDGEHLKRTAEVQHLDIVEDHNADCAEAVSLLSSEMLRYQGPLSQVAPGPLWPYWTA